MADEKLVQSIREHLNLSDSLAEELDELCRLENIPFTQALLRKGVISRRQLSELVAPREPSVEEEMPATILTEVDHELEPKTFSKTSRRYILGEEIARGGMGRIVEATDTHLRRTVAIKQLLPEKSNAAWGSRFLQEAEITGQLQHPSIVPVYDIGTDDEGHLFFAMKRIEGITLHDIFVGLRNNATDIEARFTHEVLLSTFQSLCLAVAYAHSRSVIHRDIKPSNVMIGEFGEVFLMDWGLAKITHDQQDSASAQIRSQRADDGRMTTRQGETMGTPGYMAPELALGQLHLVDERADVYALGAVLYEMLTLRRPYSGKNTRTVIQRMLKLPVTPARQRAPNRKISEKLEHITARALERDPDLRYRSVLDLHREVHTHIAQQSPQSEHERDIPNSHSSDFDAYWRERQRLDALNAKLSEQIDLLTPWSKRGARHEYWHSVKQKDIYAEKVNEAFFLWSLSFEQKLSERLIGPDLIDKSAQVLAHELTHRDARNRVLEAERLISTYREWPALEPGSYRFALRCDLEKVSVEIRSIEDVKGTQKVTSIKHQGATPFVLERLRPGQYFACFKDERFEYNHPFEMTRLGHLTLDLPLSVNRSVPNDFQPILASEAYIGGDTQAFWSRSKTLTRSTPYALSKTCVTMRAYSEFLNDLHGDDETIAFKRYPRSSSVRYLNYKNGAVQPNLDQFGNNWSWDWPVFGISRSDAVAYCAWLTERSHESYRLPTSTEWEIAGRGADQRVFPWGNLWDPTFSNNALANPGAPKLAPVGTHPKDESPFGLLDMAGGVAEWTSDTIEDPEVGATAICKGGSWTRTDRDARLASRHPMFPDTVSNRIGMRLAITL